LQIIFPTNLINTPVPARDTGTRLINIRFNPLQREQSKPKSGGKKDIKTQIKQENGERGTQSGKQLKILIMNVLINENALILIMIGWNV